MIEIWTEKELEEQRQINMHSDWDEIDWRDESGIFDFRECEATFKRAKLNIF